MLRFYKIGGLNNLSPTCNTEINQNGRISKVKVSINFFGSIKIKGFDTLHASDYNPRKGIVDLYYEIGNTDLYRGSIKLSGYMLQLIKEGRNNHEGLQYSSNLKILQRKGDLKPKRPISLKVRDGELYVNNVLIDHITMRDYDIGLWTCDGALERIKLLNPIVPSVLKLWSKVNPRQYERMMSQNVGDELKIIL